MSVSREIATAAARLVVDEGMDYAHAKSKAARDFGRRPEMPSNEELEDAVREHIELFCADTQPVELQALRALALVWMRRLQDFRPHLSGAVWRGTATRLSALKLDLYCDDPKAAEIALINAGVSYDSAEVQRAGRDPLLVLVLGSRCAELDDSITVHLMLHDTDDQRGALKPDARGRPWRGDIAAVIKLMETSK